jgi:hypothetical protein
LKSGTPSTKLVKKFKGSPETFDRSNCPSIPFFLFSLALSELGTPLSIGQISMAVKNQSFHAETWN